MTWIDAEDELRIDELVMRACNIFCVSRFATNNQ